MKPKDIVVLSDSVEGADDEILDTVDEAINDGFETKNQFSWDSLVSVISLKGA